MTAKLSPSISCAYQMCEQAAGHSVCAVVKDHYDRLVAAASALAEAVETLDVPDAMDRAQALRDVLAEAPEVK